MTLFLEIVDGAKKGTRTRIEDGLVIGRREGGLTIEDSKLSGRHAQVQARPDGELWLIDLGSANGVKTTSGEKVPELRLIPGLVFTLGRTSLRVISPQDSHEGLSELTTEDSTVHSGKTVTRTFWDAISELAKRAAANASDGQGKLVQPFGSPFRLVFTRGIQTGTEWFIGYGPRSVGAASLDLHLEDPSLPALCFKLLPEQDGVHFVNKTTSEARLNGKWVEEADLKHGDIIDIVNTQIQVRFDAGK